MRGSVQRPGTLKVVKIPKTELPAGGYPDYTLQSSIVENKYIIEVLSRSGLTIYSTGPCNTEQESEKKIREWTDLRKKPKLPNRLV